MSKPNTMFQNAERDDDTLPLGAGAPVIEDKPAKYPGITLVTGRIKVLLEEAFAAVADANLANSQSQPGALIARLDKIASLALSARWAVTKACGQQKE